MKKSLLQALCLSTVLVVFYSCQEPETTEVYVRPAVPVQASPLSSISTAYTAKYTGIVAPKTATSVMSAVSGKIKKLYVEEGQYVSKGQKLMLVDTEPYSDQIKAYEAQLKLAEEVYNKMKALYEKGSIAEIKYLEAKSNYEQVQAAIKASSHNVEFGEITANISGYVANCRLTEGMLVGPGAGLFQIISIADLQLNVSVPASEVNSYKVGDKAKITFPDNEAANQDGSIEEISIVAPMGTPNYIVKLRLQNIKNLLRPGMSGNVAFEKTNEVIASNPGVPVPLNVIQLDADNNKYVFVVDKAANTAIMKPVTVLNSYEDIAYVQGDIKADDLIITSGYHKITNNTKIEYK